MHRLFWPLTDLDQMNGSGNSLSLRLSDWAEDWLPKHGDAGHELVSELACPADDDLLVFCRDSQFWAAVCLGSSFRNELLAALPSAWHSAGDDERQLLERLAAEMLADLRRDVFGLADVAGVQPGPADIVLPSQLARLSFEIAPGESLVLWCSADFVLPVPSARAPDASPDLRKTCLQQEAARLTASVDVPTSMDGLLNLAVGDVLPLAPLDNSPLTLKVSGQALCQAYLGRSGDKKALLLFDRH